MSVTSELQPHAYSAIRHWTGDRLRKLVEANQGREILDLSHHNFDGENLDGIVLAGFIMAGASFCGASLVGADLSRADLRGANFERANLLDAQMVGSNLCELEADSESISSVRTNLTNARLEGVNLTSARLRGAILRGANLKWAILRDCLMENADLSNVDFRGAIIDNVRFRRQALGKYIKQAKEHKFNEAQQIYLVLKENFLRIGAYDDASWAYVEERSNERATFFPPYALEHFGPQELPKNQGAISTVFSYLGFITRYFFKWSQSAMLYLIWGYGQKPANASLFSICVILIFAAIYYLFGGIVYLQGEDALSMFDCLVYSMNAFVTNNMDTIKPKDTWFSMVTALEGMGGVAALALFTASLGQRMGGR